MDLSDFTLGSEFTCADKTYRVTDIGSRVIVAIHVDAAEISTRFEDGRTETNPLTRAEAEAVGWFKGPPYAVVEQVFDEDDIEGCIPV